MLERDTMRTVQVNNWSSGSLWLLEHMISAVDEDSLWYVVIPGGSSLEYVLFLAVAWILRQYHEALIASVLQGAFRRCRWHYSEIRLQQIVLRCAVMPLTMTTTTTTTTNSWSLKTWHKPLSEFHHCLSPVIRWFWLFLEQTSSHLL
jgi:hypothetical protein